MLILLLAAALADAPGAREVISTTVEGSIEASLVRAHGEAGAALGAQVARLLRWRGNLVHDIHPGDRLAVLWEQGVEGPELTAIAYAGSSIQLRAYRFDGGDGVQRFWDAGGTLVEPRIVASPVPSYVQITELKQRGRGVRKHAGIDLKAPTGTEIRLPFGGVVSRVNWSTRRNGRCVEVRYDNGIHARFLHLEHIDDNVKPGVRLAAGARLGGVGSTGRSTSPHLHYEMNDASGTLLDPLVIHGTEVVRLEAAAAAGFAAARARADGLLPEARTAQQVPLVGATAE